MPRVNTRIKKENTRANIFTRRRHESSMHPQIDQPMTKYTAQNDCLENKVQITFPDSIDDNSDSTRAFFFMIFGIFVDESSICFC